MNLRSSRAITRRDALKTIGAGAALFGLGALSIRAVAAGSEGSPPGAAGASTATAASESLAQPFALPKLPYAYGALEPHIDQRTMEIHHTKHHQAYIANANKALADHPDLQRLTAAELLKNLNRVPESIRTTVRNNVGGHANHSFFWQVIGPASTGHPSGQLAEALTKTFGSFDGFKAQFADAAMKRFGSGWAWLSLRNGALNIHSTANQDSPLSEGAAPILGLDVWEHAYYLHYQNRRAEYVTAFWNVVNWTRAEANYQAAQQA